MDKRRERVEVDLPFIHVYVDGDGVRVGSDDDEVIDMEAGASGEYYAVRRAVRKRLRFFRHAFIYIVLNGLFVLLDWSTGGSGSGVNWAQWVALVWGVFLAWEFISVFVGPLLWGRAAEERWIQHELRKRHGG
jgi:hypothetical protein